MTDDSQGFEVRGQWWLPEQEGKKVAGSLIFSPEKGSKLHLIGALDSSMTSSGLYPRIHGLANGSEFTLEDCFRVSFKSNNFHPEDSAESVRVQQVFKGVWFTEPEEPNANQITAKIRYLTQWVGTRGIKTIAPSGDECCEGVRPFTTLQASLHPDSSATLSSGITIRLRHHLKRKAYAGTGQMLLEWYVATLDFPELISTSAAADYMSDVQDLVSIACGRMAEYDEVAFGHPAVGAGHDGSTHRKQIQFFVDWATRDQSKKPGEIRSSEMYFTFEDLGGMEGVRNWMESAKRHRTTLGRVMASKYRNGLFMEDRIFHRAAAIEAFARDRIGYRGVKLPGALAHCCNLAGPEFATLVGDVDEWRKIAKSYRDDIGHHYGRRPNQGGSHKYFLAESLYWLFALCMLRDSAASENVFRKISNHHSWAWLAPKVQAVVQAG